MAERFPFPPKSPTPTSESPFNVATFSTPSLHHHRRSLTLLEASSALQPRLDVDQLPIFAILSLGATPSFASAGAAFAAPRRRRKRRPRSTSSLNLSRLRIKEVRGFTDLGLKETKEMVEKAPMVINKGVTKEEAEISTKLVLE